MGKIKRLALITMLASVVSVVAACGRNDNSGSTSGSTAGTTAQMTETTTGTGSYAMDDSEPYVNDVTNGNYTEETGGILKDMVDDVEQGIDNVTDGIVEGTINGSAGHMGGANGQ